MPLTRCGLIKVAMTSVYILSDRWLAVSIAPDDTDLEVCAMDNRETHALVFPCRKIGTEWIDASTRKRIDIRPTHWRKWSEGR